MKKKSDKTDKKEIKFINYKAYIIIIASLAIFLLAINLMYRNSTVFATEYSNNVYPYIAKVLGVIFSIVPFSVFELLIVVAISTLLFCIGRLIYLLIKYHAKPTRFYFWYHLKKYLLNLVCIVLVCLCVYSLTCGINYYRIPFSTSANFKLKAHSKDDLKALCAILVDDANKYSKLITKDENNIFSLEGLDTTKIAAVSMEELSVKYPCLSDYYPKAKPILFSPVMSYQNICGIYSPFTVEANYNNEMTDIEKPFTICHELSHLSGFMREDEANFIAYLGCMESDNPEFKYSGTVMALIYVSNQLYANCNSKEYNEIMGKLDEQIFRDLNHQSEFWRKYEEKRQKFTIADKTIADISSDINNSYLQSNGQTDGVKSYDRITDLLLAYYEEDL